MRFLINKSCQRRKDYELSSFHALLKTLQIINLTIIAECLSSFRDDLFKLKIGLFCISFYHIVYGRIEDINGGIERMFTLYIPQFV